MKKALILFCVLAVAVSATLSCQKENQPSTPEDTIQAAMKAYQAKNFEKFVNHWELSSETERALMIALYTDLDKSGSLPVVTRCEIVSTTISKVDGVETATVKYRLYYEGKPDKEYSGKLVKKDGKWLISSASIK